MVSISDCANVAPLASTCFITTFNHDCSILDVVHLIWRCQLPQVQPQVFADRMASAAVAQERAGCHIVSISQASFASHVFLGDSGHEGADSDHDLSRFSGAQNVGRR